MSEVTEDSCAASALPACPLMLYGCCLKSVEKHNKLFICCPDPLLSAGHCAVLPVGSCGHAAGYCLWFLHILAAGTHLQVCNPSSDLVPKQLSCTSRLLAVGLFASDAVGLQSAAGLNSKHALVGVEAVRPTKWGWNVL